MTPAATPPPPPVTWISAAAWLERARLRAETDPEVAA